MTVTPEQLDAAWRKIETKHEDWYDFCAEIGQIPDNIQHTRGIGREFAEYLYA